MKRYNIFNNIHKGLRACLYDCANAVQQSDFNDPAQAALVMGKLSELIEMFGKHATTEDEFILPIVMEYEPSVVTVFHDEHRKDEEISFRLRYLIHRFSGCREDGDRETAWEELAIAFIEFMVFNLNHMAKEEDILNRILWRYYPDEQLHQHTKKIVAAQEPRMIALTSRWMIRGLNNSEILSWYRSVKNHASDTAFQEMMALAEAELGRERWSQLQMHLCDGAMVA
ncbi:MAG: hypothetical protein GC171_04600 [Terrimonas sp.]|nr:hypothetical protein [Terrimonas sp.]